ncbi:cation:proton antiporter [Streptomyces roseifaciens]|uniref:cation:proton antiporter n=1 Tax=Streptomyces roseifaciens TaxID=1488406 RepID=UPI000717DFF8|nr:cation:proton antiporter [Streptomyces roseifaciens]
MTEGQITLLLVDLALIIALAKAAGRLARALGQPQVIGEILIGVALGPTFFGGALSDALLPVEVRPYLGTLANLGLVLFMFVVGLELDFGRLRGSGRMAGAVVAGSTLVPFVLGLGLAAYLLCTYEPADHTAFVLFIGVAVSVTAFPVLARILSDRGMSGTWLGTVALSTAAVCDLAAWTALAGVQALVGASGGHHWKVLLVVPYAAVLFLVVRPLLKRFLSGESATGPRSAGGLALVLAGALVSAAATQWMGLHFVMGAFLFGLVVPRLKETSVREDLLQGTQYTTELLLPVYFVVAGLKVNLSGIGADGLVQLAAILFVAIAGKFAGTWLAARSQGLSPRGSAVLACLMNTRGLTELIALGIGLEAGLLDERLYSLFVVMAVLTTAMAGPLLRLLAGCGDEPLELDYVVPAPTPRAESRPPGQGPARGPRNAPVRPEPPRARW